MKSIMDPSPSVGHAAECFLILTRARKLYAHGEQRDYFNRRNCISQYSFLGYRLLVLTIIQGSCATGAINTRLVLPPSWATVAHPPSAFLLVTDMPGNCGQIILAGEMRRYSLVTAAMEFSQSPLWVSVSGLTLERRGEIESIGLCKFHTPRTVVFRNQSLRY